MVIYLHWSVIVCDSPFSIKEICIELEQSLYSPAPVAVIRVL